MMFARPKVIQHIEQDTAQLKAHEKDVKAKNGLVMDKAQLQKYLSGLLPLLRQVSSSLTGEASGLIWDGADSAPFDQA